MGPLRKLPVALCALVTLGPTVLAGCGDDPSRSSSAGGSGDSVLVEVVSPAPAGSSARSIQVAGTVEPFRRTPLGFKVGGRVAEVLVELGDRVDEDEALARLELRDLRIAVREAQAAVKAAQAGLRAAEQAGYELADRDLERARQLADAGGASAALLDQAEARQKAAHAGLLEAQAGLQRARALRDRARSAASGAVLEAPFDAVVVQRSVEKGQIVGPGVPVFVVENIERVRIMATVSAADLPRVDPAGKVEVRVDEAGGELFAGEIRALGWAGDPATGTFPVEILVDNPQLSLRSGMAAWVDLPRKLVGADERLLVVPLPAVVSRGDGAHVFVVEDGSPGRARRVPVALHGFEGDRARVSGDLGDDARVVVRGQHDIEDGAAVRLVPREPEGGASR